MKNESILQFDEYYIEEFIFKKNSNFSFRKDQKIELDLNFSFDSEKKYHKFIRKIDCRIFDEKFLEKNDPFYLRLLICGVFYMPDFDEGNEMHTEIIKKNTLAILFPYLRSVISHMTLEMQIEPIKIPPVNINTFFDN